MKNERELSGLRADQYPKHGDYQEQIESGVKTPELSYLLRLMMWLRHEGKPRPSQRRLRKLLILWCLARLETLIEMDDIKFKAQVLKDYLKDEKIPVKKGASKEAEEKYKKDINECFRVNLKESALEAHEYFEQMLYPVYQSLERQSDEAPTDRLPTLESFPEAFKPLVVIVGGYGGPLYREPEHVSELFRESQSLVNLHYLLSLNLGTDTEVVSDRLLLQLKDDRERAEALLGDRHILVIGSPLVNAFSRHLTLNKKLIFNFVFQEQTYRLGQAFFPAAQKGHDPKGDQRRAPKNFYDSIIETGLLETLEPLSMFYRLMNTSPESIKVDNPDFGGIEAAHRRRIADMVNKIRDLTGKTDAMYEDVTNKFWPKEMFSPFDATTRVATINSNHEVGIISLGENYWASLLNKGGERPKRALIFVSGINELSTTVAVRVLGRKDDLRERPLGGLLDITKAQVPGLKQVTGSRHKWLTATYKAEEVLKRVAPILQSDQSFASRPSAFNLFEDKDELKMYREMVNSYT